MVVSRRTVLSAKKAKQAKLGEFLASKNARRNQGIVGKSKVAVTGRQSVGRGFLSVKVAGDLPEVIEVDEATLARVVSEQHSIRVLGAAMAAAPEPVSPELVRSLQAEENWWRKIDQDFPSLSSTQTAALMGAKATNRNFASAQRGAGKLLGYTRRHAVRYPKFQFDDRGAVLPAIRDLIAVAREFKVADEDLVMWLVSPSTFFAEQDRPVDHLHDRGTLLAAARDEFGAEW